MASNLQLISGSPLIGSPIVYQVKAGSPVGDVTFQRVKLYVTARLSTDNTARRYEMSPPADKGETVEITYEGASTTQIWEYTIDGVAPESGRMNTIQIQEGQQIEFSFNVYSVAELAAANP